jgi:hypothetical protein
VRVVTLEIFNLEDLLDSMRYIAGWWKARRGDP